ncbi:DUF3192 domain-containing protein [Alteromonas sp. C1M14]|uniref:DUF3192 domain-containing protein n=1 Tax=Alteromonas sp. C1M14 TaxID=2841567 RepID=UPI001C092B8E|nr:DUF3192 domain-containing protein [Alteromonas sp. C1M14]MBU2977846.1 DUF3192 domain-containing protein [Alteromonas sp. C1M14]
MKHIALALAVISPLALSGCVISVGGDGDHYSADWEDREQNNRKHVSQLEKNMTYESVVRTMGVADFNEMLEKGDHAYRILFYRTNRTMDDGMTTKDECTPLIFEDGVLVGWGDSAYQYL